MIRLIKLAISRASEVVKSSFTFDIKDHKLDKRIGPRGLPFGQFFQTLLNRGSVWQKDAKYNHDLMFKDDLIDLILIISLNFVDFKTDFEYETQIDTKLAHMTTKVKKWR